MTTETATATSLTPGGFFSPEAAAGSGRSVTVTSAGAHEGQAHGGKERQHGESEISGIHGYLTCWG